MKRTLLLLVCFSNVWANLPSVESLFRHGANADIAMNTVKVEFEVEKLKLKDGAPVEDADPSTKSYVTAYFIKKNNNDFDLLQLSSNKKITEESKIGTLYHQKKFLNYLSFKKEINLQTDIFYSVLTSISLNESVAFSYLLKKTDGKFKKNSEVMNHEKLGVLRKYKKYLSTVKENPDSSEGISNPMNPADSNSKDKVREILKSSIYVADENLQLRKKNQGFVLTLELENYLFNFTNEGHQFLDFSYKGRSEDISMHFKKFILFNGTHQLPSKLIYKLNENEAFLVSFSKLSHFNVSRSFYEKKIKTSQTLIDEDLNRKIEFLF